MLYDKNFFTPFANWCKEKYDWEFDKEEITTSPGIIPALYQLLEDLVKPVDGKILIMTPSYGFFAHSATYNDVGAVFNKLIFSEGHFEVDFDALERQAADPDIKLLLFCNPHNPTGKVWTQEELQRIAEIVEKNNLWIISDEIHCDLLRKNVKHIPMGKIMPTYKKLITCMSASKTFNMAGLHFSHILIRDEEERARFIARDKNIGSLNPLSIEAHKAAYEHGGQWLESLKEYLDENFRFVKNFLAEYMPEAIFEIPDATYLAWVDMSKCAPQIEDLTAFFANEAGVLVEGGDALFVDNAEGFVRLNLAMPRSIIEKGLVRMRDAIESTRK